jgi:hypothetical protein
VTGGFQIYGSQQPMYQHSYPPSHQQNPQVTIPSINQQIIQTPPKAQQQQQQTFQTPIQATPPPMVYPIMQNLQHQSPASMPLPPQQQHIRHPPPVKPIQESLVPFSSQPRFTPLPNSMPSASTYFPSTSAAVPPSLPPPRVPTPSIPQNTIRPSVINNNNNQPTMQNNNNFKNQNKRGGAKMNKSQKRFQDFNNQQQLQQQQPKGLDPKFAKLDMDLIRTMPPPPIPKIILEEKQRNEAQPPSQPATIPPPSQPAILSFRSPFSSTNNPPVQQISQPTNIAPLNNVENLPARLPPPSIVQQQRPEIRPNLQRPGAFPPPQRPPPQTSMRPPRMNTNGPYPPPPRQQPPPPQNMQRPQQPLMRPSIPTPDSSSVMRTLFSALHTTAPQQQQQPPHPSPMQQQMFRRPPPQQFRPPINPNFIPRMPFPGPPRFRPRR